MKFSSRSLNKLSTCHVDLQLIMTEAIKDTCVDFGVSEGHRSLERQKELFDKKLSKVDGISKKGKHNYYPSLAVDIYAYVPNKNLAYDEAHLAYLGGHILKTANILLDAGKITHRLRWGFNWDMDGELKYDQTLIDGPHFELIPKG